jgi:DNA-binding transcriptional MerR regulator
MPTKIRKPASSTVTIFQDDEIISKIETLSAHGMLMEDICYLLNLTKHDFYYKGSTENILAAAYSRGRSGGIAKVGQALFSKACTGDVPAIKWWETSRGHRKEIQTIEVTHQFEDLQDAELEDRIAELEKKLKQLEP